MFNPCTHHAALHPLTRGLGGRSWGRGEGGGVGRLRFLGALGSKVFVFVGAGAWVGGRFGLTSVVFCCRRL